MGKLVALAVASASLLLVSEAIAERCQTKKCAAGEKCVDSSKGAKCEPLQVECKVKKASTDNFGAVKFTILGNEKIRHVELKGYVDPAKWLKDHGPIVGKLKKKDVEYKIDNEYAAIRLSLPPALTSVGTKPFTGYVRVESDGGAKDYAMLSCAVK